jgi:predicted nucleotide-binding protein (sugar kinase/HSP70/actin superfamily)
MSEFESLKTKVGKFSLADKTLLMPEMSRAGSEVIAAALRSFGVDARVMQTYEGLHLGKQYTSGKECFPCQITLGDILYHLEKEKARLADEFRPENYLYFMAEADGPCRFGMYNKLHRLVFDSLDGLGKTNIVSVTSKDSYSLGGLLAARDRKHFRRTAYVAVVIGDVLDRILWRTRPYEKEAGQADDFFEQSLATMITAVETHGRRKEFSQMLDILERVAKKACDIIDPTIPPKPLIGMVGEIYLRSHRQSNQDLIRLLETYGAESVNATIAEWINYISYERRQDAAREVVFAFKQRDSSRLRQHCKDWLRYQTELTYQYYRQDQIYRRVQKHLPIHNDHRIGKIEKQLDNDRLFSFHVGTEACLSIGGALEYCIHGFDGIVNVFPFTCMPSTMCSAVLKPILDRMQIPYIDTAYDGTYQPNLQSAIRTFMFQAAQHQEKRLAQSA